MKKLVSLFLALTFLLIIPVVPAMAENVTVGQLSYLNLSEEDNYSLNITIRIIHIPPA